MHTDTVRHQVRPPAAGSSSVTMVGGFFMSAFAATPMAGAVASSIPRRSAPDGALAQAARAGGSLQEACDHLSASNRPLCATTDRINCA